MVAGLMPKLSGKPTAGGKNNNETPASGFLISRDDGINPSSPAALPGL